MIKQMIRLNDGRHETVRLIDNSTGASIGEFERVHRGTPIGTMIAVADKGYEGRGYRIGWSLCNFDAGEKWNRWDGERLAEGRARGTIETPKHVPYNIRRALKKFEARAQKVFSK